MWNNKKELTALCRGCAEPTLKAYESPSNKGQMENGCTNCGDHYAGDRNDPTKGKAYDSGRNGRW